MNIAPISFCKKIPLNNCQVIDKIQNAPIKATVYEYDCNDLEDVYEVGDLDDSWAFRDFFTSGMHSQFLKGMIGRRDDSYHYYCAKDENDNMLGLCQTTEDDNSINVKLIVSNPSPRYKYVGQTILASLGQKAINKDIEELKVKAALNDVYGFYETCGFEQDFDRKETFARDYKMKKGSIPSFIKRTQEKVENLH